MRIRIRCCGVLGQYRRQHWPARDNHDPGVATCIVAPAYLLTDDLTWIFLGFIIQGFFGGALPCLNPTLTERFPTEVRSTASGFCYHLGAIFGGLVPPVISLFAVEQQIDFAVPMLIGTMFGATTVVHAVLISPETKGKVFVSDLTSPNVEVPVVSLAS
jgi:SHS family lactate transporter-like MFS transporter